ncbi:multiple sugar transport system permease protein [Paenibacillus shirakamiensis]|uniref:Multiple sugar transport system permease protein n=1 Tax=Paenibacillus shirakamiensis TaxID=1265935 RepID=A0ABS4JG02_9BACL|nr:carbohydrate ABC transporter permease [Paenibacillus shirakamiensis]MBP2000633.1 multiple sugar transport system permease protein [Paenibacillus shirakamiensis]
MKFNKKTVVQSFKYGLLFILFVLFMFPVYWIINVSLQNNAALFQFPPHWAPQNLFIESYRMVLASEEFLMFYKNTFIVAAGSTLLSVLVSILAGYGFSKFRFPSMGILLVLFLSTQMFPAVTLLIGLYTLYGSLGLLNTYAALILASTTTALPFCIMLMKTFFDHISKELGEAAEMDGATQLGTLIRVILPLSKPGIMAVSIYTFLVAWDDFLFGLTLVSDLDMRTLSPGLSLKFLGEFSYNWSAAAAAAVIATVPLLVVFLFLQRFMVAGLSAGSVKE